MSVTLALWHNNDHIKYWYKIKEAKPIDESFLYYTFNHRGQQRIQLVIHIIDLLLFKALKKRHTHPIRQVLGLAVLINGLQYQVDHALLMKQILPVAQVLQLHLPLLVAAILVRLRKKVNQVIETQKYLIEFRLKLIT